MIQAILSSAVDLAELTRNVIPLRSLEQLELSLAWRIALANVNGIQGGARFSVTAT